MRPEDVIHASAPGKLFLLGEYAVLEGAPALLSAVDRRARVTIRTADGDRWRVSAPNLALYDVALGPQGQLPENADTDLKTRLAVFDAVRCTVAEAVGVICPRPLAIEIDTAEFARDGHKLGLGSSAAVAAALTGALLAAAGQRYDDDRVARLAIAAHRSAQNGTGSGGDVAVAVHGGVISYIRDTPPRSLDWPTGLTGAAVVTGQGASTPDLVARVYAYRRGDPDGFARDIRRLADIAGWAATALACPSDFLALAEDYFKALIALDEQARAGIVSRRHHELADLARNHGAVFKSSGAGGGDVGLLFAPADLPEAGRLRERLADADAHVLDLAFGAPGLSVSGR